MASLAVRLGMNRSPASMRTVVFVDRDRRAPSFLLLLLDGVCPTIGPVPVSAQSETPSSRCRGEFLALAMFDFGESLKAFEEDRANCDGGLAAYGCESCLLSARGGVNGDEWLEVFMARLVVLVRGDGVSGIRPPAVRVENMPWWLLRGVDTLAEAIVYVCVIDLTSQCVDRVLWIEDV